MSISVLYSALINDLEGTLNFSIVKRFPGWARLTLTPPQAALGIMEISGSPAKRIGQAGLPNWSHTWQLAIFCSNEPELLTALDNLIAWFQTGRITAGGTKYALGLNDASRHNNETGTQTEAHAFIITFQTREVS